MMGNKNFCVDDYKTMNIHGKDGVSFLLQHLINVPETGRFHGWHFTIQGLMREDSDYLLLEQALSEQNQKTKTLVLNILQDITVHDENKAKLIKVIDMD